MATLIGNSFSSYELNEEEQQQGDLLTLTQKQVIQNDIANYAESKIALEYDATDPTLFIQQEAKLAGQMQALNYRLDCSNAAEQAIFDKNNPPQDY